MAPCHPRVEASNNAGVCHLALQYGSFGTLGAGVCSVVVFGAASVASASGVGAVAGRPNWLIRVRYSLTKDKEWPVA